MVSIMEDPEEGWGRFRNLPIQRKLFFTIALTLGFAILVASSALLIYEARSFRPRTLEKAESRAEMLAEILVPPMEFDDSATCAAYLRTLRHTPDISSAVLCDTGRNAIASYSRTAGDPFPHRVRTLPTGPTFGPHELMYLLPVSDHGHLLGYLALREELPSFLERLPQYGIMLSVIALSLLALAAMLALVLKHTVTAPIVALAGIAKAVTEDKDYGQRVKAGGKDEVGSMTAAFNMMLDALEQREHSLLESRALLQSVIDNSMSIIFVKDPEGRYILINRRFEDIFHVSLQSVRGRTDRDIFPEESAEAYRAGDLRALAGGRPVEMEEQIPQDDGRHTYITVKYPLRDAAGKVYAVCGIATDITQIKNYEEQLRQSQKMEAIGRLAGGISHDFNNLLTAINGYSMMALQSVEAANSIHGFLEEILKAGERAAGLTRQLLAYSRKQILEPRIWNLNEIVMDIEKMLRRLIGEDVRLTTRLAPDLKMVKVDRGQLEQIILNLALNARDAMTGGGELIVKTGNAFLDGAYAATHPEVAAGPYVQLEVSDTGSGMNRQVMSHLFEPFFTTKEPGKGTGLGLSVVYGIVQQSGGSISVSSEPGKGTTFSIYLPTTPVSGTSQPEGGKLPEGGAFRGKETVLLVEDEEVVRRFTRHILEAQGYAVLEAVDGVKALEAIAGHAGPVDLILSDVVMPHMGGPELAERLRKESRDIPMLFISGYADGGAASLGPFADGNDFLQKPFSPYNLAKKVREILDRVRTSEPES